MVNAFKFNLRELAMMTKDTQILNFDGVIDDNILDNHVKLSVVDYSQYFGANIDRNKNAE